ncbi:MAG: hypothetical protein KDD45_06565 [Bdellovibrionales bacterium]|nr:hypothetical protein [Bdellovibrionales bacterium]
MEKISGIIPGNSRTSKADLSRSQPVRPGAPNFGQPIGRVTLNSFSEPTALNETQQSHKNFFVDNRKMGAQEKKGAQGSPSTQVEDRVSISSDMKNLKSLKEDSDDLGNEVRTRPDIQFGVNSKKQDDNEGSQQMGQYNKKGEVEKAQIAEEVSKRFSNLEA